MYLVLLCRFWGFFAHTPCPIPQINAGGPLAATLSPPTVAGGSRVGGVRNNSPAAAEEEEEEWEVFRQLFGKVQDALMGLLRK